MLKAILRWIPVYGPLVWKAAKFFFQVYRDTRSMKQAKEKAATPFRDRRPEKKTSGVDPS